MRNKILLSVAASALLITSAFSATPVGNGDLSIALGGGTSTIEYHDKYGDTSNFDFTDLKYRAQILGSGSVSDALVRIDVTDTNLTEDGVDLDTIFDGQRVMNNDTNETIATYDRSIVDDNSRTWVLFASDSEHSIVNGKDYRIRRNDSNATSGVTYKFVNGKTLGLDVYSTSGSEEVRDKTHFSVTSTPPVPQFSTACVTTFDGLINIENFQDSFVSTNHDNNTSDATDGLSQKDTIVFTLNNDQKGNFLEGNATAIFMQTRNADGSVNVDNNFSNADIWNGSVVAVEADGTSTTANLVPDTTSLTTDTALDAGTATATAGSLHYTTDGNLTFILPNTSIANGTTTYYLNLTHTAGAGGIKPVEFVNSRLLLEAGLSDNKNKIYPAADTPRGATQDAGKWVNHAYISQIPAGESGGAAGMITRYYITNRSCATVTPQIDVVYDGHVYPATDVAPLAVNTQGVYALKDIMLSIPELATVWNANTSTKVSVEITLPGIAEDFYIYAQVKNKSIHQFKDLPVYSTSERD